LIGESCLLNLHKETSNNYSSYIMEYINSTDVALQHRSRSEQDKHIRRIIYAR